jgi:hypothetical protein
MPLVFSFEYLNVAGSVISHHNPAPSVGKRLFLAADHHQPV